MMTLYKETIKYIHPIWQIGIDTFNGKMNTDNKRGRTGLNPQ